MEVEDATPRTVKQIADDLEELAAAVALAGERHDHSTLPQCAVSLRRIADMLMREMDDTELVADDESLILIFGIDEDLF